MTALAVGRQAGAADVRETVFLALLVLALLRWAN